MHLNNKSSTFAIVAAIIKNQKINTGYCFTMGYCIEMKMNKLLLYANTWIFLIDLMMNIDARQKEHIEYDSTL